MRHPHSVNLLIAAVLSSTITLLTGMPGVTGSSAQPGTPSAAATNILDDRIRGWIEEAIDPETGRGTIRLPAVGIDQTGDLTVVFALREKDDLGAFRAAAEEDVFRILRAVDMPALVLVGEEDAVTPAADAQALASAIPGARLAIIPAAGHLSNLENPTVFNGLLAEFLSGRPTTRA